jgi:hypothetical protein
MSKRRRNYVEEEQKQPCQKGVALKKTTSRGKKSCIEK